MKYPEEHPLQPFLPDGAKILMLGSFPPERKRWSMDFFYPNFQNDMWRIFGYIFFADKQHFILPQQKRFDRHAIEEFLRDRSIALFDTASTVIRTKDNASDKFLEIVKPTDIASILERIPQCRIIATTGQKAAETLCEITHSPIPKTGGYCDFEFAGRDIRHYRMPSSSRAYPKSVEDKSAEYENMFRREGIL